MAVQVTVECVHTWTSDATSVGETHTEKKKPCIHQSCYERNSCSEIAATNTQVHELFPKKYGAPNWADTWGMNRNTAGTIRTVGMQCRCVGKKPWLAQLKRQISEFTSPRVVQPMTRTKNTKGRRRSTKKRKTLLEHETVQRTRANVLQRTKPHGVLAFLTDCVATREPTR